MLEFLLSVIIRWFMYPELWFSFCSHMKWIIIPKSQVSLKLWFFFLLTFSNVRSIALRLFTDISTQDGCLAGRVYNIFGTLMSWAWSVCQEQNLDAYMYALCAVSILYVRYQLQRHIINMMKQVILTISIHLCKGKHYAVIHDHPC